MMPDTAVSAAISPESEAREKTMKLYRGIGPNSYRVRVFLAEKGIKVPEVEIDLGLDVTQIPNFDVEATPLSSPRPIVPFKDVAFWAQGINAGLEIRW